MMRTAAFLAGVSLLAMTAGAAELKIRPNQQSGDPVVTGMVAINPFDIPAPVTGCCERQEADMDRFIRAQAERALAQAQAPSMSGRIPVQGGAADNPGVPWTGPEIVKAPAAEAERARICRPGFSRSLRPKGAEYYRMRDAAFKRAGIPQDQQCHKGEAGWECLIVDHCQPLELGPPDPNGLDNIQIQTKADSLAKDAIENEVRGLYCAGKITHEEALARFKRPCS